MVLVLAVSQGPSAAAQPVEGLHRIEPGLADVGAEVLGRRNLRTELRRPSGFDTVYRFNRTDAMGRRDDVFVRIGGGVTAVFPRSTYVPTGRGLRADIPPGTVFHLGRLPDAVGGPRSRPGPPSPNQLSFAAPSGLIDFAAPVTSKDDQDLSPPQPAAAGERIWAPSIFEDEDFRRRRIGALLGKAANGDGAGPRAYPDGDMGEEPLR